MSSIPPLLTRNRLKVLTKLVFVGIFQAGATVASSLLARSVFDQMVAGPGGMSYQWLAVCGVGFAVLAVVIGQLCLVERVHAERIGQSYAQDVRLVLFDHLTKLSKRTLQLRSQGGVMLRFVGDMTAVRLWVSLGLSRLTVAGLTTVVSVSVLATMNGALAMTIIAVLLWGGALSISRGKAMRDATRQSRRHLSRLAANINEKIAAVSVLQAFGQTKRERDRVAKQSLELREAMVEKGRVAGSIRGLAESTSAFCHAATLIVGAIQVNEGQTSPGTVIAALTVVNFLVSKLRDLGRVQEYWHGYQVSRVKIAEFLAAPTNGADVPASVDLFPGLGRLEFNNVSLSGTLQNISVAAEAGTVVVLVGPNGAGKSTLLSLAARLMEPTGGEILIDGQDIAACRLESVRRAVGLVGPDFPLLRGSVERNLRYRCPKASDEEYDRVKTLCGIDALLAELPDGAKTRISEGGVGLSVGQRQRIALARALLGSPRLLLMDEADANLDAQASAVIDQIIETHTGTIILVSHNWDRIRKADVVWFMDNGRIIEVGSPDCLFWSNGPAAQFFAPKLAAAS
jgi:ABC-type multidrug transport system fused ATPase/permease subunit